MAHEDVHTASGHSLFSEFSPKEAGMEPLLETSWRVFCGLIKGADVTGLRLLAGMAQKKDKFQFNRKDVPHFLGRGCRR